MGKVYLYLIRRNKKDTKIVGVFRCDSYVPPSKVDDINLLGLPAPKVMGLKDVINNHKIDWDLWLESAENYNSLKQNLINRNIIAASSPNAPLLAMDAHEIPKSTVVKLNKNKVMLRRDKH